MHLTSKYFRMNLLNFPNIIQGLCKVLTDMHTLVIYELIFQDNHYFDFISEMQLFIAMPTIITTPTS